MDRPITGKSGARPPVAQNVAAPQRLGTASGRPPGTASRLMTAKALGTGAGQTAGGGVALNIPLTVEDRPTTQHGLGGLRTAQKGERLVQDKTYFVGLLRQKLNETIIETTKMKKEIKDLSQERDGYLTYQKKAEELAAELKIAQGEMADYNVLVEHLVTESDAHAMRQQLEDMKATNQRESTALEALFARKQEQESLIAQLEIEMDQERRMTDNFVTEMNPKTRERYEQLKSQNDAYVKKIESLQQQLDQLLTKQNEYEAEIAPYPLKIEAVKVLEDLAELDEKKERVFKEEQERGTPAEQREKLLSQVKRDNQEIATIEPEINELQSRVDKFKVQISELDRELEEGTSELQQKFKELRKREDQMDEFMATFEDTKRGNEDRIAQLEGNVVSFLEHISRTLARFTTLPSADDLSKMKKDLEFKEGELKKSESTAVGISQEQRKLQQDTEQIEQLEVKVRQEIQELHEKQRKMKMDMDTFSNLEGLKRDAEEKKQSLIEERAHLKRQFVVLEATNRQLKEKIDKEKASLEENENYKQLIHLETKLKGIEANNFSSKDFIAAKMADCDYKQIINRVKSILTDYNKLLLEYC